MARNMDGYGVVTDRGFLVHVRAKGDFWEITVEWKSLVKVEISRTVRMWKIEKDPTGDLVRVVVDRVVEQFRKGANVPEVERRLRMVAEGETTEDVLRLVKSALG